MKIGNIHNLPEPLVKAITWDIRPREGFSVTDLITPPRITQLQRRHWSEIEEDASQRIWLLLGTAVHYILEKGVVPESLKEERLLSLVDGVEVRGRPDLWYNNMILDYKVTSVWTVIYEPDGRTDWHRQLNLYKYLYEDIGFPVEKLAVCAILRDWSERKVGETDYPAIPVVMYHIPIWSEEETRTYLSDRVKAHKTAEGLSDEDLPLCTSEEMWEKPTTYALMKDGRKTAIKLFDNLTEASKTLTDGTYILERPGERVRCERYCPVNRWCNQYREYKEEK